MPAPILFPIHDRVVARSEKEARLRQRARVVWLFGLSGSGKSTLAIGLERALVDAGHTVHLLDGDSVRTGLNRGLGFSEEDRQENLRRVAEVARLFLQAGVVTVCAFITPKRAHRALARGIVGAEDFLPVFVDASLETCARRDPKGLYAKAAAGEVAQFSGRDAAFEPPGGEEDAFILRTEAESAEDSLARLLAHVRPKLSWHPTT